VTITGFSPLVAAYAGFRSSLAGGGAVTAGAAFAFPAWLVTTAGPASGAAFFRRGGGL
jgi:hypothetical protein